MSDPCTRTRLSQRMAPPTVKQRILSGPISDTSPHHGQDRNNRCQINSLHLTCGEILKRSLLQAPPSDQHDEGEELLSPFPALVL
ncbi:unnamed protein product [Arctogadus glacialis]